MSRRPRSHGFPSLATARRMASTSARMAVSPSEQATATCFWLNACARPLPSSTQRLSAETRAEVLAKLTQTVTPSVVEENRRLHRYVIEGVPVEVRRADGSIGGEQVRLIDFDDPDANDWLAVNQYTVIENKANRRPDVVIFVNGSAAWCDRIEEPRRRERNPRWGLQPVADLQVADHVAVPHQRSAGDFGWHCGAHRLADRRPRAVHALAHGDGRRAGAQGHAGIGDGAQGRVRSPPLPRSCQGLHRLWRHRQ